MKVSERVKSRFRRQRIRLDVSIKFALRADKWKKKETALTRKKSSVDKKKETITVVVMLKIARICETEVHWPSQNNLKFRLITNKIDEKNEL